MTPDNEAPDIEQLTYSTYSYEIRKASKILPSTTVHDRTDFACPRCKRVIIGGIEHCKEVNCAGCDLWMRRAGNGLEIAVGIKAI